MDLKISFTAAELTSALYEKNGVWKIFSSRCDHDPDKTFFNDLLFPKLQKLIKNPHARFKYKYSFHTSGHNLVAYYKCHHGSNFNLKIRQDCFNPDSDRDFMVEPKCDKCCK